MSKEKTAPRHKLSKKLIIATSLVLLLATIGTTLFSSYFGTKETIVFSIILFAILNLILCVLIFNWINRPLEKLLDGIRSIGWEDEQTGIQIQRDDEMGLLAEALDEIGKEIGESRAKLKTQRDEYQNLFEQVPCIVTVQDRTFLQILDCS